MLGTALGSSSEGKNKHEKGRSNMKRQLILDKNTDVEKGLPLRFQFHSALLSRSPQLESNYVGFQSKTEMMYYKCILRLGHRQITSKIVK